MISNDDKDIKNKKEAKKLLDDFLMASCDFFIEDFYIFFNRESEYHLSELICREAC